MFAEIEELAPCLDAAAPPGEFLPGVSTEAAVVEKAVEGFAGAGLRVRGAVNDDRNAGQHDGAGAEDEAGPPVNACGACWPSVCVMSMPG